MWIDTCFSKPFVVYLRIRMLCYVSPPVDFIPILFIFLRWKRWKFGESRDFARFCSFYKFYKFCLFSLCGDFSWTEYRNWKLSEDFVRFGMRKYFKYRSFFFFLMIYFRIVDFSEIVDLDLYVNSRVRWK